METQIFAKILNIPELPKYLDQVEKRINQAVSDADPIIKEPIDRLLRGLGKPKRAFFVIAAALCVDGTVDDKVIAGGAAIEMANIAVSVHDDIMDDAETRWGVASVNTKEGSGQALLVGDYLLVKAVDQASVARSDTSKSVIDSIISMVNGQSQETADRYNLDRTIEAYYASIQGKTASLIAAACKIGGLCAGASAEQVKALYEYGEAVGMTLQILDDLLDLLSTQEILGKPVDRDIREGVYTLPVIFSLSSTERNRIKAILRKLPRGDIAPPELLQLLISTGSIEKSIRKVNHFNEVAAAALKQLDKKKLVDGLVRLPADCLDLIMENAVRLRS